MKRSTMFIVSVMLGVPLGAIILGLNGYPVFDNSQPNILNFVMLAGIIMVWNLLYAYVLTFFKKKGN
jgi:hypothetical protein